MSNNFVPVKRPKPSDTEYDVLQMQQEFLSNNLTPSAQVIRNEKNAGPRKKLSKFAERKEQAKDIHTEADSRCAGLIYISRVTQFVLA